MQYHDYVFASVSQHMKRLFAMLCYLIYDLSGSDVFIVAIFLERHNFRKNVFDMKCVF